MEILWFYILFPQMDKIREKFRSAEELKKDLDEMQLNIETDTQIMKRLIDQYQRDDASVDERTAALYDLEFYVHQVIMMDALGQITAIFPPPLFCNPIKISISLEHLYQTSSFFYYCKDKSTTYLEIDIICSRFFLVFKTIAPIL